MIVLSDSSPLITLAKVRHLDLLPALYKTVTITPQVYDEVVLSGVGLAGSSQASDATWIEVKNVRETGDLAACQEGLAVLECVGILHETFDRKLLFDLHESHPAIACVRCLY